MSDKKQDSESSYSDSLEPSSSDEAELRNFDVANRERGGDIKNNRELACRSFTPHPEHQNNRGQHKNDVEYEQKFPVTGISSKHEDDGSAEHEQQQGCQQQQPKTHERSRNIELTNENQQDHEVSCRKQQSKSHKLHKNSEITNGHTRLKKAEGWKNNRHYKNNTDWSSENERAEISNTTCGTGEINGYERQDTSDDEPLMRNFNFQNLCGVETAILSDKECEPEDCSTSTQIVTYYDEVSSVKTFSIDRILVPLMQQISSLVSSPGERGRLGSVGGGGAGSSDVTKQARALERVGQGVNVAVDRFVTVGEAIADDNPEIKVDMYEACKEARAAGQAIEKLCESAESQMTSNCIPPLASCAATLPQTNSVCNNTGAGSGGAGIAGGGGQDSVPPGSVPHVVQPRMGVGGVSPILTGGGGEGGPPHLAAGNILNSRPHEHRGGLVRAARCLLASVTRVLLLADTVVVKQLLLAKDKISHSMSRLESVTNFTEFVSAFSQFGGEMVELAHLTAERQSDLKDERRRAQMAAARKVLDRSTMMLLIASKVCLRHPECVTSRENRDTVFCQMRRAMDLIHYVVKDGVLEFGSDQHRINGHSPPVESQGALRTKQSYRFIPQDDWDVTQTIYGAIRRLEDNVEMTRMTLCGPAVRDRLCQAVDIISEWSQDFTDSAYTSHEHRENILLLADRIRLQLNQLLRVAVSLEPKEVCSPSGDLDAAISAVLTATRDLRTELQNTALEQATEIARGGCEESELMSALKNAGLATDQERLDEYSDRFLEHIEHIQEVCKLLRHVATTEALQVAAKYSEINLRIYGPQVVTAAQTLCLYPTSKIAKENVEVFCEMWMNLVEDVKGLTKDVGDQILTDNKPVEKQVYMSLPRPGKHGTTSKVPKPTRLDQEEQAKLAKSGLDMKMISSEVDQEAEKWEERAASQDEDNDIVKRAKNMSSMAFSMYQFTRGEGALRTTQDLFTQGEYFAEEANRLYKVVRQFSYQLKSQVPAGPHKKELMEYLDQIPTHVQLLQYSVKNPTVGKAATFTKVDNVIQETKNLMNVISKVVTTCFVCATKYELHLPDRQLSSPLEPAQPHDTRQIVDEDTKQKRPISLHARLQQYLSHGYDVYASLHSQDRRHKTSLENAHLNANNSRSSPGPSHDGNIKQPLEIDQRLQMAHGGNQQDELMAENENNTGQASDFEKGGGFIKKIEHREKIPSKKSHLNAHNKMLRRQYSEVREDSTINEVIKEKNNPKHVKKDHEFFNIVKEKTGVKIPHINYHFGNKSSKFSNIALKLIKNSDDRLRGRTEELMRPLKSMKMPKLINISRVSSVDDGFHNDANNKNPENTTKEIIINVDRKTKVHLTNSEENVATDGIKHSEDNKSEVNKDDNTDKKIVKLNDKHPIQSEKERDSSGEKSAADKQEFVSQNDRNHEISPLEHERQVLIKMLQEQQGKQGHNSEQSPGNTHRSSPLQNSTVTASPMTVRKKTETQAISQSPAPVKKVISRNSLTAANITQNPSNTGSPKLSPLFPNKTLSHLQSAENLNSSFSNTSQYHLNMLFENPISNQNSAADLQPSQDAATKSIVFEPLAAPDTQNTSLFSAVDNLSANPWCFPSMAPTRLSPIFQNPFAVDSLQYLDLYNPCNQNYLPTSTPNMNVDQMNMNSTIFLRSLIAKQNECLNNDLDTIYRQSRMQSLQAAMNMHNNDIDSLTSMTTSVGNLNHYQNTANMYFQNPLAKFTSPVHPTQMSFYQTSSTPTETNKFSYEGFGHGCLYEEASNPGGSLSVLPKILQAPGITYASPTVANMTNLYQHLNFASPLRE